MKKINLLFLLVILFNLQSCGIQSIPTANNEVEATFAEVDNQYKRRSDLIPALVNTVKGYTKHESGTLTAVVEARAKATQVQLNVNDGSAEQFAKYQAAQGQLSQALGKLMSITENYPDLKANENFKDLQTQLEGTENRITIARRRYIEAVKVFNNLVTVFPTSLTNSLFLHYSKKPQFSVEAEQRVAPRVEFN